MIFGFLIIDNILMQNFLPQRHAAPEVHYLLEGKVSCIFLVIDCELRKEVL